MLVVTPEMVFVSVKCENRNISPVNCDPGPPPLCVDCSSSAVLRLHQGDRLSILLLVGRL